MNTFFPVIINLAAFAAGQWLITRRHWSGFLVWAASNYYFAMSCLATGNQPTAFMFLVYCSANVYSMWIWSRTSPTASELDQGSAATTP